MSAFVELVGVGRTFAGHDVPVLDGVDLVVRPGDRVALTGPSGSGKSTLLSILGLLDRPDRGVVRWDGRDVAGLGEAELAALRRDALGFVFQDHHLLPQLSALDNVLLPRLADGPVSGADRTRATELLSAVGLADRLHHPPARLSTGQRQRVAVARALLRRPRLVLADEPTGALDAENAHALMTLLLAEVGDAALVVVTHDPSVASALRTRLRVERGRLVSA